MCPFAEMNCSCLALGINVRDLAVPITVQLNNKKKEPRDYT